MEGTPPLFSGLSIRIRQPGVVYPLISLVILFLYVLPFYILGPGAPVMTWDNLDSVLIYYKVLAESGKIFGSVSDTIPAIINGLPRNSLGSEFSVMLWLHYLFPPYVAYVINLTCMHFLAFFGMYLLLRDHIIRDERYLLVVSGAALCFALLPFWPYGGLSIAGQPLVLWAFLNIRKDISGFGEWIILFLVPFWSSFPLSYFFFLIMVGLLFLYDTVSEGKIRYRFLAAIVFMVVVSLLVEYRLFYDYLLNPGYQSVRAGWDPSRFSATAVDSLNAIINRVILEDSHGHSLHQYFISLALLFAFLILWFHKERFEKHYFLLIALMAGSFLVLADITSIFLFLFLVWLLCLLVSIGFSNDLELRSIPSLANQGCIGLALLNGYLVTYLLSHVPISIFAGLVHLLPLALCVILVSLVIASCRSHGADYVLLSMVFFIAVFLNGYIIRFIKSTAPAFTSMYALMILFTVWIIILGLSLGSMGRRIRGAAPPPDVHPRDEKMLLVGFFAVLAFVIFAGFWRWEGLIPFKKMLPLLAMFQFDRFYWLCPLFWYITFGIALKILWGALKSGKTMVLIILLLQGLYLFSYFSGTGFLVSQAQSGGAGLFLDQRPSFSDYYKEDVFQEINTYIGRPRSTYRVVSMSLDPSVALYNGFYTLDFYSSNYPLYYKYQFRTIIEKELAKSQFAQESFDRSGVRLYLVVVSEPVALNVSALKSMKAEYILSGRPVVFAEPDRISLLKVFTSPETGDQVWVYQIG